MKHASRIRRARRPRWTRGIEPLEPRLPLAADLVLSEFMASNVAAVEDGFGQASDWIEIYNRGDEAVDLLGFHLTDNAKKPTKWRFTSSAVLGPGESMLIFASGRNTRDPAGSWHTNFSLAAGGEYVGLFTPTGLLVDQFGTAAEDYPPQISDVSYGRVNAPLVSPRNEAWYLIPTDGLLGTSWTAPGFDAAAAGFSAGTAAVGYESNPGSATDYRGEFSTAVPEGTTAVYVRVDFQVEDAAAVRHLNLGMKYDDGFAVYLNGTLLLTENAGNGLAWNATASADHADAAALRYVNYRLDGSPGAAGDVLDLLVDGTNTLAVHMLNRSAGSSDFLMVPMLTSDSLASGEISYLAAATPGAANSPRIVLGPEITGVTPSGAVLTPGQAMVFTAAVSVFEHPVDPASVVLHTRRMFAGESRLTMNDEGLRGDAVAGDGIFSATVAGSIFASGEMFRWFVTAEDVEGNVTRAPRFLYAADSAEYFGTVVTDAGIDTDLPVLQWFVQDPAAAATRVGTRASLAYGGRFYDNIQVDLHGQTTAGPAFPKKSFDFDANSGDKFDLGDAIGEASDFNLLTNYADQTKIRHPLAYEAYEFAGHPALTGLSVVVYRNGQFYGLYDIIEETDEEYLERVGLDPNGALYKVNNRLDSATINVEKKSREYEGHGDFQEVVAANALTGAAATAWDFDHLDIATFVNNMAVHALIANTDFGHKNMLWYHDNDGTGQWYPLPWDQDLSFGHRWTGQYFDNALYTDSSLTWSGNVTGNNVFKRFYENPRLAEMFFRRLRTLSDEYYGPPGSDVSESPAFLRFEALRQLTADEAAADLQLWGLHPNYAAAFPRTPSQAIDQVQQAFIDGRRTFITTDPRTPAAQVAAPAITIDPVDRDAEPESGLQAEEYLRLNNGSETAIDISGWQLVGDVQHTFRGGTVIPAGGSLYVVKDVQAFLARPAGPGGGQQLFIQGNYTGSLRGAASVRLEARSLTRDRAVDILAGTERLDDRAMEGDVRLVKRGAGRLVLGLPNGHSGGVAVEAGELAVRHGAALGRGGLTVSGGAIVRLEVGNERVMLDALELAAGAILDLGMGSITIAAGGFDESLLREWIAAGRGGGSWNGGSGIRSAAAAANGSRGVGYLVGDDGSVTVAYTVLGDLNLDGAANVFDLLAIANGGRYGTRDAANWSQGDVNYDGVTDIFDVIAISNGGGYGAGSITSQAVTLTAMEAPEPVAASRADLQVPVAGVPPRSTTTVQTAGAVDTRPDRVVPAEARQRAFARLAITLIWDEAIEDDDDA